MTKSVDQKISLQTKKAEAFRSLLLDILEERKQKNHRYSIRSFAKSLEVDHSLLTKVLKGSYSATYSFSYKVLSALKIPEQEFGKYIIDSSRNAPFNKLREDTIEIMTDWRHFFILEAITLKKQKSSPENVAALLNLTKEELQPYIQRLADQGLVFIKNGLIQPTSLNNTWVPEYYTTEGRKKLMRDLLQMSIDSIDNVPFEERDHSSLTVAIRRSSLPQVKEAIKKVRRQLINICQEDKNFDDVYQLTISFFPLTKRPKS